MLPNREGDEKRVDSRLKTHVIDESLQEQNNIDVGKHKEAPLLFCPSPKNDESSFLQ